MGILEQFTSKVYRKMVIGLSPLVAWAIRGLMTLLFRRWRRSDMIELLSLENMFGTRERIPVIRSLIKAVNEKGRMTADRNLALFKRIQPVFSSYVDTPDARILEMGPGLLNPFSLPFLFLLHGYAVQYFGVDIGAYRWDFAFYGLGLLIDDVIKKPQKYGFESRSHSVAMIESIIDFDALASEEVSKLFVGNRARFFLYDGVCIDEISNEIGDIDFLWSQDVFEHLVQPDATIERLPCILKRDGIMLVDVNFRDHSFRDKDKDEWSFLEHDTWPPSLNRLRAHGMIDGVVAKNFEIVGRWDEVKALPEERRQRFAKPFCDMSNEQLSIVSSRFVCKPLQV